MRFTNRAKHALFFDARDRARRAGHDVVGGDHVLLALLAEREGLAAHVLASCAITLERAGEQLGAPAESGRAAGARVEHNAEVSGAIDRARAQARAFEHERIGTAHVLLGLLAQGDGVAVGVVRGVGADPGQVRERLLAEMAAGHGDYDGFSRAARAVVTSADDQARRLDDEYVASEHLLLALQVDDRSVAVRALTSLGVTREDVQDAVMRQSARDGGSPAGPIALADDAKRALAFALAEAHSCGSRVNPEHILLGLARERDGLGARVLIELAGGADEVRSAVLRELAELGGRESFGYAERFTQRAATAVIFAQQEARILEDDHIGSEHILLGLVREQADAGAAALGQLEISVERAREQIMPSSAADQKAGTGLLPLAASATKAFGLALQDAAWLEHDHITPAHLALALVRESDGAGARILEELGVDRQVLRAQALRALDASWASAFTPAEEDLSRMEQRLRDAQRRYREATTDKERERLAASVNICQGVVDSARGKLLPGHCHAAIKVLVDFATEQWLQQQPPSEDPDHRRWYERHCTLNIENQLLGVLFHPSLGPEANPISGHPGGPDAPDPRRGATPFTLHGA